MAYSTEKIRNICLLGHGGDGKTSLVESMLYLTGKIDRLGKTADGNTVCDYDPEEIKRKISIQTTLATVETQGYKLNVLDTPGYFDFAGEVAQALRVAGCGIIVVSAKDGVNVGTEKAWRMVRGKRLPSSSSTSPRSTKRTPILTMCMRTCAASSATASRPLSSLCSKTATGRPA